MFKLKELKDNQNKQINKVVNSYIDENFKSYFDSISKEYVILFKKVNYNLFRERLKELILNPSDERNPTPTLISGYWEYRDNIYQRLCRFQEDLKDKETEDLINFSLEDFEKDYENDYYENDYIIEDLNTIFNTEKISNKWKSSRDDIYILIEKENYEIDIISEMKYNKTFKDFLDDLENNLLYDIDKEMLIISYIYEFHSEVFKWYSETNEIEKDIKNIVLEIEKEIKTILIEREKELKKAVLKNQKELLIIKNIFTETIEIKNRIIENFNLEIEQIKNKTSEEVKQNE